MQFSLSSSHNRVRRDTASVMRAVCYACIPGIMAQVWFLVGA